MADQLEMLARLGVLVFVVASMAALGLRLTLERAITPLRNIRNVAAIILANFVFAPVAALGIAWIFSLEDSLSSGLLLLATAAGAPFLPKLVEMAGGSVAESIGFMVVLMVATIFYLPIVLPHLLPGVDLSPVEIARPLIIMMLLPLGLGILLNRWKPQLAGKLEKPLSAASNVALVVVVVLLVGLNIQIIVGLVGSRGLLAAVALTLGLFAMGYFLPGQSAETAKTIALGTAQRNVSAALVVAGQNFDVDVVTYVLVASLVAFVILLGLSRYLQPQGVVEEPGE